MIAPGGLSRRTFVVSLLAIVAVAALVRGLFPTADPPWNPTVGVVWHDEGAWVHNARNKALFGAWSADRWNPMYIAPVFTGLEYASFAAFGVGIRQARLVPEVLGVLSVWLLALGVARIAGRPAGLAAGALLACNYVYVSWNRAAMMEGPMVAFMVFAWYCHVRSDEDSRWAMATAVFAWLAFFTKAAAAFFVAALGVDAVLVIGAAWLARGAAPAPRAAWTLLGSLAAGGILALAAFVMPNWTDYQFYNWQMSVTRKPSYDLRSVFDRLTWLPVLHDTFTRMWFAVLIGFTAALGALARWRTLGPGERLLVLWVGLGACELILHDVGNERRFIFFIPALVALGAIALGRGAIVPDETAALSRRQALLAAPLVAYTFYVIAASILRLGFLYEIRPNVRLGAAAAVLLTIGTYAGWPRLPRALSGRRWRPETGLLLALLVSAGWLAQYVQWAAGRTYKNVTASRELGRLLPPGTLVHGKLANGLALENRIRPVFVGRGFGNYEDRKSRDDVRYILTYIAPSLGYESQARNPVIKDVLDAYPNRRVIMTFDVAETVTGRDRAALIDKFGSGERRELPPSSGRAHD
jgi:4-amino-4-deoxy-L-arabinose transferase-like glycosyltransferase